MAIGSIDMAIGSTNMAIGWMSNSCNCIEWLSYHKSCVKVHTTTEMEMYSVTILSNQFITSLTWVWGWIVIKISHNCKWF